MSGKRVRAEQRHVVVTNDGVVWGTTKGGPLTRDAAWLLERWFNDQHPELKAVALKISPTPEEFRHG